MKSLSTYFVSVAVMTTVSAGQATAYQWQAVYHTDFSADPNWITNDPANNYWDSATQSYHTKMWDHGNQYAYVTIPYVAGNSYRLQFDSKVTQLDWAANFRIGLGDSGMQAFSPTSLQVNYHAQDYGGNIVGQMLYDSNGHSFYGGDPYTGQFTIGNWYTNELVFDASTGNCKLSVTDASNGLLVGSQTVSGFGPFNGINRLFIGSVGDNEYWSFNTDEAFVRNVTVSMSPVPEPSALALLGVGAVGLTAYGWRRRASSTKRSAQGRG